MKQKDKFNRFEDFLKGRIQYCWWTLWLGLLVFGGGMAGLRFQADLSTEELLIVGFMLISGGYLVAMAILLFIIVLIIKSFTRPPSG